MMFSLLIISFIIINVTVQSTNYTHNSNNWTIRILAKSTKIQNKFTGDMKLSTGKLIISTKQLSSRPLPTNTPKCKACPRGAFCNKTTQKCQCHWDLVDNDGGCRGQYLDGYCFTSLSCNFETDGSICNMNRCQCSSSFVKEDGNKCLPVKAIGQSCFSTSQCLAVTANSICNNSFCKCAYKFIPHPGLLKRTICLKGSKLGEQCNESDECKRSDINSICDKTLNWIPEGFCKCKKGYDLQYSLYCSKLETTTDWLIRIGIGLGSALLAGFVALIIAIISKKVLSSLKLARLKRAREMIQQQCTENIQANDNLPKYEDVVTIKDIEPGPPSYYEVLATSRGHENISCITEIGAAHRSN